MIWPILEARAKYRNIFNHFFCSNEDIQNSFWNYLTFMKFYHQEYILGSKRVLFTRDLKAQSTFAAWNPCWFFVEYKVEFFWDCHKNSKTSPSQFWHYSLVSQIKVSKSQKQILKFAFEPKNERKYFCISAQAPKSGQIKKI